MSVHRPEHNPFRTSCIDVLPYRAPGLDWQALIDRVCADRPQGIILGPKGYGKTTFCMELAGRLQRAGKPAAYVRVFPERDVHAQLRENAAAERILIIDGGELLNWKDWLLLRARKRFPAGLLVTRHTPNRWPVFWECTTSPDLLGDLVNELSGNALSPGEVRNLWSRHDGNIREALRECYDRWRSFAAPSPPRKTLEPQTT